MQAQRHNIIIILSIGHSLYRCHRSNRTNVGESAVCREFKPWMGPTRTLTWHRSETCKRRYSRFVRKVQTLLFNFFFSNNNKNRVNNNNNNEYNDYDVSEHTRVCAKDEYTDDSAIIILFSRKTFFRTIRVTYKPLCCIFVTSQAFSSSHNTILKLDVQFYMLKLKREKKTNWKIVLRKILPFSI